jgi:hypothetical protein
MMPYGRRPNFLRYTTLALFLLLAPARDARAEMPFFDFSGFSYVSGPPTAVGTVLTVAGKFNPIQPNPLWPLELSTTEYTVMIQGLSVATVSSYGPYETITYSGGSIQVHADLAMNGMWSPNPPNGSVPATFLDGNADLIGDFSDMTLFFDTVSGTGTVSGTVNWQGGSRRSGLANPFGWTIFGGVSSHAGLGIPAGYDLAWDPQLWGPDTPNPTESRSWGALKNAFRSR